MIGNFWSTGIVLECDGRRKWWARAKWQDDGHCVDGSAWLKMGTSYAMPIEQAINTLMKDAADLGLEFRKNETIGTPHLYLENENYLSPIQVKILQIQAVRIGWTTYD